MAALERTVAFAQVDPVPVGIEQDLGLDMAGAFRQALQDQPVIAERGSAPRGGPPRAHP